MKAHLEALAQAAEKRAADKPLQAEENPGPMEDHRVRATAPEAGLEHAHDAERQANTPTFAHTPPHKRSAPHHAPVRTATDTKSSRLNCAAGVWRYAAGYWFL